jgi:hypothetical protein
MKRRSLLFFATTIFMVFVLASSPCHAHHSPNTLVFLDVSSDKVAMEIQLPLTELELAFGNEVSKNPETLIERLGTQLKEYLKTHIKAYVNKDRPWDFEIASLNMDKGKYVENGIPYWEVIAHIVLKPSTGDNTRRFLLDYDVIMHQVVNHVAMVAIRSDWETGKFNDDSISTTVIGWNTRDNIIYPLEISLDKGSRWRGFIKMIELGIHHIKEGTDHLLFLIVLLFPAMLVIQGKTWGSFGGMKYTTSRLLKIITAFTIGHSITLLIGAMGWVRLPAQPVEVLIAFSILISAIHAIYPIFPNKEMYVGAGFGLVHGLAFAAILANLHLSAGNMALGILGFNVGIELMQLFIIVLIVPWLILLSQTDWYKWFRIFGASLAGLMSLAWIAERVSGRPNAISKIAAHIDQYAIGLIIGLAAIAVLLFFLKKSHYKSSYII